MTNEEAAAFARHFHDVRSRNDPEQVLAMFTDDAVFSIAGEERAGSIAVAPCAPGALAGIAHQLVGDWHWRNVEFKTILADGDDIVVRYVLTVHNVPQDRTVTNEIVDFMTLRDGKVAHMRQFVDTALLGAVAAGEA